MNSRWMKTQGHDLAFMERIDDRFSPIDTGKNVSGRNPAADSFRFQSRTDSVCNWFVFRRIADENVVSHENVPHYYAIQPVRIFLAIHGPAQNA
jgi:hypothetical protein